MKRKLLTDAELRAVWPLRRDAVLRVSEDTIFTPAARDYLREHGIRTETVSAEAAFETMTVRPIPMRDGRPVFREAATGRCMQEKPENMTHLQADVLVSKRHPRIAFRGKLDALQADVICAQTVAAEVCPAMVADLGELLALLRRMMAAEVKDEPLQFQTLLQMSPAELRHASHDVKGSLGIEHPTPDYRMGRLCAELNRLRTRVREAELAAVHAFCDGDGHRAGADIVAALNRLSSAVYILYCREAAGFYREK